MPLSNSLRTAANSDGAVVIDMQQGHIFSMNPVGEGRTSLEIAHSLATTFSISMEQALSDVQEFMLQLDEQHLLRHSDVEESGPRGLAYFRGLFCRLLGRMAP